MDGERFMVRIQQKKRGKYGIRALLGSMMLMMLMSGCGDGRENILQGMLHIKELDYQAALVSFDTAEQLNENPKLNARGRGIAYMGLTRYEEAESFFLEALGYSNGLPEDVDYDINLYLAAVYDKMGRYTEAEEIYDAILALHPGDEDVLFLRGGIRLKLNDYANAKKDMDRVVELDGQNFERVIQIYEAMEAAGHKDAGQSYLTDALQTYETKMSHFDKGRMYYYMGEYQKAYLALEEAKSKGGAAAYQYLGMAYEATGDFNYASSVYNSYLAKTPDAGLYNQLGLCEMKKGDYEKALAAFQAGLQTGDNTMKQSLLFNEIVAYEYMSNFEQAAALMGNYLKIYPDDETAAREYQFLSGR